MEQIPNIHEWIELQARLEGITVEEFIYRELTEKSKKEEE